MTLADPVLDEDHAEPDRSPGLRLLSRVIQTAWTAVYVGVLLWSIATFIAPLFGYQGYVQRDARVLDVVVAVIATAVVAWTLPPTATRPSDVARLFLVLTCAIPVIWIPVFYGSLTGRQSQGLSAAVMVSFLVIGACVAGRSRRRLVVLSVSRTTYLLLVAGFGAFAVVYLLAQGISLNLSSFADVYAQRQQYADNIDRYGAYLVGWLAAGTMPVVIAVGLQRRSVLLTGSGLGGVLLMYSLTGYKSYAIAVPILVGTFVMTRRGWSRGWHWTALLSLLIVTVGTIDRARDTFVVTSLLVRRAISTAGINTAYFVELFDGGPYYGLRHSVLSFLGPAPYDQPPALVVGEAFYDDTTSANANFMADGFANGGWIGVAVAALAVGILLRAYDRVAAGLPLCVSAPALIFILLALANTAVLTTVATHGAAVLLLWVSLLPRALSARPRRRAAASVRTPATPPPPG